jgi:hypothetical protein
VAAAGGTLREVIDEAAGRPFAWEAGLDELSAGAAEIVTERQAEWERARASVARAREQGTQYSSRRS